MLSMLSGHPRAYSTLIPSKDHREAYLEILAWLMKGGWVTQLRTFAWVRVEKWVKDIVSKKEDDEKRFMSNGDSNQLEQEGNKEDSSNLPSFPPPPKVATHKDEDDRDTTTILLEPHKANNLQSRWLDAIGASFAPSPPLSSISFPPLNDKDKERQSEKEKELVEVQEAWPRFVKYFNGKHPLEKIPVREGLKKKDVWRLLQVMEKRGVLIVVRHW